MSEEITKGLVIKKFKKIGFPVDQDTKENDVIWFKEDSYKILNQYLKDCLAAASKRLSKKAGTPDFIAFHENKEILIVVECKEDIYKHQSFDNFEEYRNGRGNKKDIENYSVNGVLHYAQYLNSEHDVIAIAVSGTKEDNLKVSSFLLPKSKNLIDLKLLENGGFIDTFMNFDEYESIIDKKLGRKQEESEKILKDLSSYAVACSNFLRSNGISAKDRAGFISAIVMALTDENSNLYSIVKASLPNEDFKKPFQDLLNDNAIPELKRTLNNIWVNIDKIPEIKRQALEEYYNKILTNSLLNPPEASNKYFKYGKNVLTTCIFSIYNNIVILLKPYKDLDIMGTFYTVFLKYASGDAKDKGIVLTPKHITELFCDIAEFYLDEKLNEDTTILDTCCGTGGFLIGE